MTEGQKPKNDVGQTYPWWRRRKKQADVQQKPAKPVEKLQQPKTSSVVQQWPIMTKKRPNNPPRSPKRPIQSQVPHNYAFIDSQNLNLGVRKSGWKMDWHKFREWLRDEYNVTQAFMFIGYMAENEDLYKQMYEHGFLVVLKPTNEIMIVEKPEDKSKDDKEKLPVKGNIDADLVLYTMKELPNYNKAVIVSNDGDFFSLIEYLKNQGKFLKLITPNHHYSMLLKPFENDIINLENFRNKLNYRSYSKNTRKN